MTTTIEQEVQTLTHAERISRALSSSLDTLAVYRSVGGAPAIAETKALKVLIHHAVGRARTNAILEEPILGHEMRGMLKAIHTLCSPAACPPTPCPYPLSVYGVIAGKIAAVI